MKIDLNMNILITALGSMSAEAVITSLIKIPTVKLVGCNLYPSTWTPASRLVNSFYQVSSAKDEDNYIQDILLICQNHQINYVIPLTDPEVDVLAKNYSTFTQKGITICISNPTSIKIARDKYKVYKTFLKNSHIVAIQSTKLKVDTLNFIEFPAILKPRYGRSSEGIQYAQNYSDLKFWQQRFKGCEYIIQPFFNGTIVVVDVIRQSNGEKCIAIAREELLRTSNGAGITVRTLPQHICESLAIEVAHSLKMVGCFNVEFIIVDEQVFLMDINPRFSAGIAFSNKSGYDMVLNHINCFITGEIESDIHNNRVEKIYTRGYVEYEL